MKLFPDERVLSRAARDSVVLTNTRIRQGNDNAFTSIMLEEVCSIQATRIVYTRLAVYSGILMASGVGVLVRYGTDRNGGGWLLCGLSVLVWFLYLLIRPRAILIKSGSGVAIDIRIGIFDRDSNIPEFVRILEEAKNERYLKVRQTDPGSRVASTN